jgi:hypothetical protein
MENNTGPAVGFQALLQWATTPPQAYAVYFVCLILIGGLSFYVGRLNPKKFPGPPPSAISAPRTEVWSGKPQSVHAQSAMPNRQLVRRTKLDLDGDVTQTLQAAEAALVGRGRQRVV